MEKQSRRTGIEADWLMEKNEQQDCLVQPEFTGFWDRKNRDYTVMIQLTHTDLYSCGQLH